MTFTVANEFLKEEISTNKATARCEYVSHQIAWTTNSKAQKDFEFDDFSRKHSRTKRDNAEIYLEEDNETELFLEMLADVDILERPARRRESDGLDGTLVDNICTMDHDGARF
jgi:hypothetical protein